MREDNILLRVSVELPRQVQGGRFRYLVPTAGVSVKHIIRQEPTDVISIFNTVVSLSFTHDLIDMHSPLYYAPFILVD